MNRVSDNPTSTPHPKRIATALRCSPEARISTFSWIQHASQEAAQVLIPPTLRLCCLAPSVTTPLYSTTVSQALRQTLREKGLHNIDPQHQPRAHEGAPRMWRWGIQVYSPVSVLMVNIHLTPSESPRMASEGLRYHVGTQTGAGNEQNRSSWTFVYELR
jgi:hypothetical protein